MQTLFPCLSPSYALKLKNHLSGTYNTSSKHAISLQYFFLSSAIKVICMRTASLSLPSAPYFAPVVNIYFFFMTYDSLAGLQEMVSVYRRPVPKRARIIPLHRAIWNDTALLCLFVSPHSMGRTRSPVPKPPAGVQLSGRVPTSSDLPLSSPACPGAVSQLPPRSRQAQQPPLTTCCTLCSSQVAKLLHSVVLGHGCIPGRLLVFLKDGLMPL